MFFKRKSLKSLEMWRFGVRTGTFFRNASCFPGAGPAAGSHGKEAAPTGRRLLQETKTD